MYNSFKSRSRGAQFRGDFRNKNGKKRFQSKTISHEKFINKNPKLQTEESYSPLNTFLDFGFQERIVNNLVKKGYKIPTRVQDEAIPHILNGKDVIGLANTGSGKTAAFVLPIIQKLKTKNNREKVLIIAPTRELAQQIQGEFREFAEGLQLYTALCVGGLGIWPQIKELRRGVSVVIGTPGRLKDLIDQGELKLDNTSTLVLDEADRMLDMGFSQDINFIISKLPIERQSLCFSATISPEISKLMDKMLIDPVMVSVRTSHTGEHIAQDIIRAKTKEEKMKELTKMLAQDHFEKVLIFGQMKFEVQRLSDELNKMGFYSVAIHGNKTQIQRQKALESFKTGKVNIMVATDVAARGIDVPNVSHVINFDQPNTHEEYVHRIGRTGRAGKPGQAYTFVK